MNNLKKCLAAMLGVHLLVTVTLAAPPFLLKLMEENDKREQAETSDLDLPSILAENDDTTLHEILRKHAGANENQLDEIEISPKNTTAHGHRHKREAVCNKPSNGQLKRLWAKHYTGQAFHPSYYQLPAFNNFIKSDLAKSDSADSTDIHLYGKADCPTELPTAHENVQDRSLCPWRNIINHDADRYPAQIAEARCANCESCVGLDRDRYPSMGCEPIYYNIPVLRRTEACSNGNYKYEKGWQKVAVACICAKHKDSN